MNIDEVIKNMNPQMLSNALNKMNGILNPEQMAQVEKAIKTTDKGELNQKLNALNTNDLQKEFKSNPALAKQLANNPELMNKINDIFKNNMKRK